MYSKLSLSFFFPFSVRFYALTNEWGHHYVLCLQVFDEGSEMQIRKLKR